MVRFRMKVSLVIFLVSFFGVIGASDESSNVMRIFQQKGERRALLKHNVDKDQKNSTNEDYLVYDLQIIIEAVEKLNYSRCGRDAMVVMEAMSRRERWAIQMFDSSSKFPVGLLYGNFYQMGNFDECVNLKQPITNPKEEPIQGQYCLATVELFNKKKYDGRVARSFEGLKEKPRHAFNSTMYWSICAPSTCTVKEIETVIKEVFVLVTEQKQITVSLTPDKCHVNGPQPITTLEIVYGTLIGVFLVFVLLATTFHYYILQKKTNFEENSEIVKSSNINTLKDAVLCFSVIRTTGKFLTTKSSTLHLECICGIKFLSMVFIILGHTCLFMVGGPVQNTNFYEQETRLFINAIFVNSPLLVDTFLLISGFLMCYLFLLELDKRRGKINVLILYIARYLRLTPSYLVVIGFFCTFFFRIDSGPLWDSRIKLEQERCLTSWWTNLLYVNNYVNTDHMCMFQSWYLAADYHLFIIAPFFIYPIWRWTKIGKSFLGVGIFVSVIVPFIITLKDKLDPTLMIFAPEVYDLTQNYYFKTAYIKTHMRAGSYFLGLLFGYVLYKLQTKGIKMSKKVIWFGWLLSAVCGIMSMYSVTVFYFPDHEYNALEAAIYASLHRIAWCISIGWIMIVCITKNASLVNGFLSWKPFIPLSRLTYCAYLANGFIEVYSLGTIRGGIYMSKLEMGTKALAHCLLTFFFAFLLCIFFESPIHGLEKVLLRRDATRNKINQTHNNEGNNNTSL